MLAVFKFLLLLGIGIGLAILIGRLVFALPDISGRAISQAMPADPATRLGRLMEEGAALHPDQSGVLPLQDGHDALASRLALAAVAERSIDAQYYIWHDDISGILLLEALSNAAARGVRVRLLLDDNGVPGLDGIMAALNGQENFEIRLFNPSTVRRPKITGYLLDFLRMNRRMHNKSFIADGAAAIIGGRNIGDEYFELGDGAFYVDMDVLATGAIVSETAAVFDAYWNSASVFDVARIIGGAGDLAGFRARVTDVRNAVETTGLDGDLKSSAARYAQDAARMEWTRVQMVADDPVKGLGVATRDQLMITRLEAILGEVRHRVDLISAYFVPGRKGTAYFSDLARAGKDVRILTNALNTTDVLMVHAGYTKYRRALLKAGVGLFELKLRGEMTPEADMQIKAFGLSGASLHAKTFAVDGARVFIGSFNFDPRSAILNCEMGFLIESPNLAQQVSAGFDGPLKTISYRPELTPKDKLIWRESFGEDSEAIYQQEPGATWLQQLAIAVIGRLPVEWLL